MKPPTHYVLTDVGEGLEVTDSKTGGKVYTLERYAIWKYYPWSRSHKVIETSDNLARLQNKYNCHDKPISIPSFKEELED